jgi:phenylalanyl-tRNA synthetase beta chain
MKISPQWVRDFVDVPVDDQRLAEDLTAVGIAVEAISGSGADTVFEMEIGTNRPDAMNHYGVAREATAIYELPLKPIEPKLPGTPRSQAQHQSKGATAPLERSTSKKKQTSVAKPAPKRDHRSTTGAVSFPIRIEEPELCPRFSARVVRGVTIKKSPEKVVHRLGLLDQRAINNAVDATNYVLWEIGKPTHVFDMDLLEGGKIIVRRARNGETLKTLDGVERKLTEEDLVVADAKKPVGLAGVMGGFDTMITDKTRNVLIESAWWDPVTIRKASRRHGIHTDASHRFERGADFESTVVSCDRVAQLILESGGGQLQGDVIDVVGKMMDQAPIALHVSEVRRILGGKVGASEIFRILKRLGFTLIPAGQEQEEFTVHIPSWRLDVEREIDLIEEIARLHGYDQFENTLPAYSGAVTEPVDAAKDATLRTRALALGYNETVSLTFISHADAERFVSYSSGTSPAVLELENPLSEEASVMRTSMVLGMLDMLGWNLNRGADDVRLFEMGSVYGVTDGVRVEPKRACLGATVVAVKNSLLGGGVLDVSQGERAAVAEAFRGFKGDVENLLAAFEYEALTYDRQTAEYFHAERSARALMDGTVVAQFGQVHPEVAAARKLRQDVFLAEIDLEKLYARGLRQVRFVPLPKYPAVERDFSFVFEDGVSFAQIDQAVRTLRLNDLRSFVPAEIFRGGAIAAGHYSILLRATFQSAERTLREDEVAARSGQIVTALEGLGGVQRRE